MKLEKHFTIAERLPLDRLKHSLPKREKPPASPKLIKDELSDWQKLINENKKNRQSI